MIHYHGTPINPVSMVYQLAGRCFCVSYVDPRQDRICHEIGQSVMLDNGAFSVWRRGAASDWPGYYAWSDRWLDCPTTWAVIPDVIDGDAAANDALIADWPHGHARAAPVWHMHEPIGRLLRLIDDWPRVCFGSSGAYAVVGTTDWHRRCTEAWNAIGRAHARTPAVHMLRGMSLSGGPYPFASVDSTDVARDHNRPQNTAGAMAARWDAIQCPVAWPARPEQLTLGAA